MAKKLKDKQERFCQEYLIDLNATQAAIRAGYSQKTAYSIGEENLRKPEIDLRIKELMGERSKRTEITQDRVLQEYARLAFLDPRKFFDEYGNLLSVTDLDDETAAALGGLEITTEKSRDGKEDLSFTKKIKLIDKGRALDSLARHLGMFEKDNKQRKAEFSIGSLLEEIDGSSAGLPEA